MAFGMLALPIFLGGAALTTNRDSRAGLTGMRHNILRVVPVHAALCLGVVLVDDEAEIMARAGVLVKGVVRHDHGGSRHNADFWQLFFLPIYVLINGE